MTRTFLLAPALAVLFLATLVAYQQPAAAQATDDLATPTEEPAADSTTTETEEPAPADDATSPEADASDPFAESEIDEAAPAEPSDAAQPDSTDAADASGAELPPAADADATADADAAIEPSPAAPTDPAEQPFEQPQQQADPNQPQLDPNQQQFDPNQPQADQPQLDPNQPDDQTGAAAGAQAGVNVDVNANAPQDFGLQFGQPTARGLTVNAIDQRSLFFDSGLRRGDVLVSLNGRPVRTQADFLHWVSYFPGQRMPVIILRENRPQTVFITYDPNRFPQDQPGFDPQAQQLAQAFLGVTFEPRYRNAAVVQSVAPGSPAAQAGLRPGDSIAALNGRRVTSPYDVVQIVGSMRPGERLDIDYSRRVTGHTEVVLAGRPQPPRYSAAYPPIAEPQPIAPQGATFEFNGAAPQSSAPPAIPGSNLDRSAIRPGDADGDGRVLDGDGRIARPRLRGR